MSKSKLNKFKLYYEFDITKREIRQDIKRRTKKKK